LLATIANPTAAVQVWSLIDQARLFSRSLGAETIFHIVCLSRDGKRLATAANGAVQIWDRPSSAAARLRSSLFLPAGNIPYCGFSNDARHIHVTTQYGLQLHSIELADLITDAWDRLGPLRKLNTR
jgi:hypothetical protein